MSHAYQVRLEWGCAGLAAHEAEVIVVADADGGPSGDAVRSAARARRDAGAIVLDATLDAPHAVAEAVLAAQAALGRRAHVLIVAAGDAWPDGSLRPSVGDELLAGRVVDALADAGIDFHAPACAVACAAAVALRGATNHLIRAADAELTTASHEEPR